MDVAELIKGLRDANDSSAYRCFLHLRELSAASDVVYPYVDYLAEMIESSNAYWRARGLILIADNGRWDRDGRVEELLELLLEHIMDEKPTVSRQFIAALPGLARGKPHLAAEICRALQSAQPGRYRDTMAPLIQRDIAAALRAMEGL